ncbi:hypothetical protein GCM10009804_46690 [Kribbella hippodromi]|uniref:CHAT domain-containing protein n=1 Tax=Kribbella hippodromi TaxID=434347 RepID=A0ABN2DSG7_9ACTN
MVTGWSVVYLAAGLMVVVFGLIPDRHIAPRSRTMGLMAGGLVIIGLNTNAPDGALTSWQRSAGSYLLVAGSTMVVIRSVQLMRMLRENPDADPDRAVQANLEGRYRLRNFDRTSDVGRLDRGIDELRTAWLAGAAWPHRSLYATNLATALRGRYERLGTAADLTEAIEVGREALRTAPAVDPRRAAVVSELAAGLRIRYDDFGDEDDLLEAVDLCRHAVELARTTADQVRAGTELAAALAGLYERRRQLDSLDEAIRTVETLVAAGREGSKPTVRVGDLTMLCSLRTRRFGHTGSRSDLDAALAAGREAVRNVEPGYRLYGRSRRSLAAALRFRYEAGDDVARIEAIAVSERALLGLPADDPARAGHLVDLGLALGGAGASVIIDRERAARLLREAATMTTAATTARVSAGLAWSELAAADGAYADAVRALDVVIDLLPRVAAPDLRRADQEHRLGQWSGIATTAASCAIADGKPGKAVDLLEQGRGILLARGIEGRSDVPALRARNPGLAWEFERARKALEAEPDRTESIGAAAGGSQREAARESRRAALAAWEDVLSRVRAEPGLGDFARPTDTAAVLAQARQGPIVYLNVSRYRSDAIIATTSGVRTLELPGAGASVVAEQVRKLAAAVDPAHLLSPDRQQDVSAVLAWMWDALAEPVADALALQRPAPGAGWQRVWWIPTGALALLPIHAAGYHHESGLAVPRTLLDRAVSSYAPTVRALAQARTKRNPARRPRPLVVAMTTTPGADPLESALTEAKAVHQYFPDRQLIEDRQATRREVLGRLPNHDWVHFACHAQMDSDAPSRGRLLLHDHAAEPMTVLDISRLELPDAELAFLSSCTTAQPPAALADEAIHLASSFQLAGFAQVIASLWPLLDKVAAGFAADVYQHLDRSVRGGAGTQAALAVHESTRAAREKYPNLPALWAGHVHVGS